MRNEPLNNLDLYTATGEFCINERKRLLLLACGILGTFASSIVFIFAIIGDGVKSHFGFSQRDMTTITTIGACAYVFPAGFFFDSVGPRPLFAAASLLVFIGTLMYGITLSGYVSASVFRLVVYYFFICVGYCFLDMCSMLTLMLNFPRNKGIVVMCAMKSLGSAFFSVFYNSFFKHQLSMYMYFLCAICTIISVLCAYTVDLPPYVLTLREQRRLDAATAKARRATRVVYEQVEAPFGPLWAAFVVSVVSIVYLTLVSIIDQLLFPSPLFRFITGIGAAFLFFAMFLVCAPRSFWTFVHSFFCGGGSKKYRFSVTSSQLNPDDGDPDTSSRNPTAGLRPGDIFVHKGVRQRVAAKIPTFQESFLNELCTLRFFCLLWSSATMLGVGMVFSINLPQLYEALAIEKDDSSGAILCAVFMGTGTAAARVFAGLFELRLGQCPDYKKFLACILYPLGPFFMTVGVIMFLLLRGKAVTAASFVYFFGMGFGTGLTPLLASYYIKCSGKVYFCCYAACGVTTVAMNKGLFGELYDNAAEKHNADNSESLHGCLKCVRTFLVVSLVISVSSILTAIYFYLCYRRQVITELVLGDETSTSGPMLAASEKGELISNLNSADEVTQSQINLREHSVK